MNKDAVFRFMGGQEWIIFLLALACALYWQAVTPIQFTGDSDSYLSAAYMLLGKTVPMPPIFRPPGYPLFLALTGAVIPGTFLLVLAVQTLLAAALPLLIYRIVAPEGRYAAMAAALIAIFSGVTTAHCPQIMTESLFMFLLFLGLAYAAKLARHPGESPRHIYRFTLAFAALNSVRPIAAPMFWLMLPALAIIGWRAGYARTLWKYWARAALLFIALMMVWAIADDVLYSFGARYSPLTSVRVSRDSRLTTYLYDLPFEEAYFLPWTQRVDHPGVAAASFGTLAHRPAMAKIRDIVEKHIAAHPADLTVPGRSRLLFGQYAGHPGELADRMFAWPNYQYANYVHMVTETDLSPAARLRLYHAAAAEAGVNWPLRWINIFRRRPLTFFMGQSHENGAMIFALVFGPLRYGNVSLIQPSNGPATRLLLTTFTNALHETPELWDYMRSDPVFAPVMDNPKAVLHVMLAHSNYGYTWFITVMLWDKMGYDSATHLMGEAADEALAYHPERAAFHMWDTTLLVAAGPGLVQFDDGSPSLASIDSYPYMTTQQLTRRQIAELQSTRDRYDSGYLRWQQPVKSLYSWFYITKPLFLLTSIAALGVLFATRRLAAPLLLMIPYGISVVIYGILVTALPRYTDPTILIPVMVTCMAIPRCIEIYRNSRAKGS